MLKHLTDGLVRNLPSPSKGNRITYDDKVQGFGIRVTATGTKSFILNYWIKGRERRYTIGTFPDWKVSAARDQARKLRAAVDLGDDPLAKEQSDRQAPTVAELCERYIDEHLGKKRPRSQQEDRDLIRTRILPALGGKKVADVSYTDVDALHRKITKDKRPVRANRTVALLSKLFSLASTKWHLRADNPCRGIERNREQPRERYLTPDELVRLSDALDTHINQNAANAVRFLLLTGARRNEVLAATWDQFDLNLGTWTKPASNTKQKRKHHVPLSLPAIELLKQLRRGTNGDIVFAVGKDGLRFHWAAIRKTARLSDVRLHDLRHSFASILASGGASLPEIGKLLGHSNIGTTARYAHLAVDPLRELANRVGAAVTGKGKAMH
jgi:integrase